MNCRKAHFADSDPIGFELVRGQALGRKSMLLEQLAQQPFSRPVPTINSVRQDLGRSSAKLLVRVRGWLIRRGRQTQGVPGGCDFLAGIPTADWIARQISEASHWDTAPKFLIRDRDGAYGQLLMRRLRAMGIRDRPTAPRSPWQNGYVERLIRSIRRECLDHLEQFLSFGNLRGFPWVGNSDSRYGLEVEASLYDKTSFE